MNPLEDRLHEHLAQFDEPEAAASIERHPGRKRQTTQANSGESPTTNVSHGPDTTMTDVEEP